ncbi:MAG TPA: zinc-binding dehydrogenase, partial [Rubrobacter sp.]|nr:zinc-binding dehydrogenase [Rubrobacter sp.]
MPRKLVAVAPRKAALVDYEEPTAGRNQVKVRVEYASPKHGTEVSLFRGDDPFVADLFDDDWRLFLQREPGSQEAENGEGPALGNQWVGVIVEKGADVGQFRVGDRVCGYGSIREIQVLDAVDDPYLLKVPDSMPWKNALCFDPAQFAFGGIRDGHVRLGDRVAIFGLGAIGAIASQMARAAGAAYVAVIDPIEKRRHAALDAGADAAFDPLREDVGLELKRATGRVGVDAAIETSGNEQALQEALRGLAYGGTIAFVG